MPREIDARRLASRRLRTVMRVSGIHGFEDAYRIAGSHSRIVGVGRTVLLTNLMA